MLFINKYFYELTTTELYKVLKARAAIFVVEQNCVYQDLDDRDQKSLHIFYESEGEIVAYMRAFIKDETTNTVQVGRVLTKEHGKGMGCILLREGIQCIREKMNPKQIYIEAQCYATGYYEREGFRICSEEFLEDDIPHIQMMLEF